PELSGQGRPANRDRRAKCPTAAPAQIARSGQCAKRFWLKSGQDFLPSGESRHHRWVVSYQPREVAERMLEHRLDTDRLRRRHRLAASEFGPPQRHGNQRTGRQARRGRDYGYVRDDDPAILAVRRAWLIRRAI